MPKFEVLVTHRIEESVTIEVSAKDAEAAEAKVQAMLDDTEWEKLVQHKDAGDVVNEIDEMSIEETTEA